MYDFEDVIASSKEEQIRAWAVERAIDSLNGQAPNNDILIKRAGSIERYIVNGLKENETDGSE